MKPLTGIVIYVLYIFPLLQWNVWDESKAPGSVGLEQAYDYTDMLGFAAWLNVLVRKHSDLGLACLAQSVNVVSPFPFYLATRASANERPGSDLTSDDST
jgi:alpha-L-arabinofuranosidase